MNFRFTYLSFTSLSKAGYPTQITENGMQLSGIFKYSFNFNVLSSIRWNPNYTTPSPS